MALLSLLLLLLLIPLAPASEPAKPSEADSGLPRVWEMLDGTFVGELQIIVGKEDQAKFLTVGRKWMSFAEVQVADDRFLSVRGYNQLNLPAELQAQVAEGGDEQSDNGGDELRSLWYITKTGQCRVWVYSESGPFTNLTHDVKLEDCRALLVLPRPMGPGSVKQVVFEFDEDGRAVSMRGERSDGGIFWRMVNIAPTDYYPGDAVENPDTTSGR